MKESGINYQVGALGLDTGNFKVYYTFEEGAGQTIRSISGGQSQFSGFLTNTTNFWNKPGSGFANGNGVIVQNASGLYSPVWTMIFGYEKIDTNPAILFQSLSGVSGFNVGITSTNRPYLETFNGESILAASTNNYSSKNVITLSYVSNYLSLGYYNFTSQKLEQESFTANFGLTGSNAWTLFPQFTGYIDFFLYYSDYYDAGMLNPLLSGLYSFPNGISYQTQTICSTGVTGYQNVTLIQTGITGYVIIANAGDGYPDYSYVFPTAVATGYLTGIVSSTTYSSGVSGVSCYTVTGSSTVSFLSLTGYAASFGMQKIQLYNFILSGDCVKDSYSFTPFDDNYNKIATYGYLSYDMVNNYTTGQLDIFWNGLAQAASGWNVLNSFITVTGTNGDDQIFFDLKSGNKQLIPMTGTLYTFPLIYSGQEIYLNGINLISGRDFISSSITISITGNNTGVVSGSISEYPIVLLYSTGTYSVHTGSIFDRNSSNVYRNGIRQQLRNNYIEGAIFDLFSGNACNPQMAVSIYGNNDNYWE